MSTVKPLPVDVPSGTKPTEHPPPSFCDLDTLYFEPVDFIPPEGFNPTRHIREIYRLFNRVSRTGYLKGPRVASRSDAFHLGNFYAIHGMDTAIRTDRDGLFQLYLSRTPGYHVKVRAFLRKRQPRHIQMPKKIRPEPAQKESTEWVGPRPDVLRAARLYKRWSVQRLADHLQCSPFSVRKWEHGTQSIPSHLLPAMQALVDSAISECT